MSTVTVGNPHTLTTPKGVKSVIPTGWNPDSKDAFNAWKDEFKVGSEYAVTQLHKDKTKGKLVLSNEMYPQ